MKTILGFDFGMKSIGVAIGQEITQTASPQDAISARDGIPNWDLVGEIYAQWQPDLVVVGLPLNMDGSKQQVTFSAQKFANRLHAKFKVEVKTFDERLTTVDAKATLFEMGGYKKLTKGKIDSASACLILESFMASLS